MYIYICYVHIYIYIMYIYILCTCIYIYIYLATQYKYSNIDITLNKKYPIQHQDTHYFLSMADPRQSSSACAGRAYSPSGEPLGGSKPPGRSMKSGDFTNKKGWNMGI